MHVEESRKLSDKWWSIDSGKQRREQTKELQGKITHSYTALNDTERLEPCSRP